jgi:hypothetical protein
MNKLILVIVALCACAWNVSSKPQPSGKAEAQNSQQRGQATITVDNRTTNQQGQNATPKPWERYASPEGALVIVGIISFGVIWYQAVQTRKSADASKLNVEMFMESQRAQLNVRVSGFCDVLAIGGIPRISIGIENKGVTAAYNCRYETWIEMLPEPFKDFTPAAAYFKAPYSMTVYPNASDLITAVISLERELTGADFVDMRKGSHYICIRIRLSYRDAFRKSRRQNFGFMTQHRDHFGALPRYNDSDDDCEENSG